MQQFTPLPLRARSVLELIDTALKVYKQYFLVLIAWSAGIHLLGVVPALSPPLAWLSYFALLLTPFKLSVAACCVAGAVRGQSVTYNQSWAFSKPRYGSMLGWLIAAWILGFIGFLLLLVPSMVLFFFTVGLSASAGAVGGGVASFGAMLFMAILGFAAMSLGMVFLYTWTYFVPLVVCMEEMRAGQGPLRRSYELLRGQWRRLIGLSTVLGMGSLMLILAVAAAFGLGADIEGLRRSITGNQMSPEFLRIITNASIGISFVMMFFEPLMMLALVLFYLDVRVRKEALDLEWATHQDQESAPPVAMPAASGFDLSREAPTTPFIAPETPPAPSFGDFGSVAPPVSPITPVDASPTPIASGVAWQELVEAAPSAEAPRDTALESQDAPLPGNVATVACPQCQAVSPATSIFCMACGTRLKDDSAV